MGISADSSEDVAELANRLELSFDVLADPERTAVSAYGVADAGNNLAMPAVFVVNHQGLISWTSVSSSMRELPTVEAILEATTIARDQ